MGLMCGKLNKLTIPAVLRDTTVHQDYADLKQTISKQKEDIKQDLTDKIEKNTSQLIEINKENKFLRKENNELKSRRDRIEQNQLTNNVILTGIPEGPYEQYSITKLRVQEMIAHTIGSGDVNDDLEKAKAIEITRCSRVGKFRHNNARPISITFGTKDDKEAFLSCKKKLQVESLQMTNYPNILKEEGIDLCLYTDWPNPYHITRTRAD